MATPVIMPRQGQSVESCIIGHWHVHVGETVAKGDTLFSYETDKAVFEQVAPRAGVLLARFFEVGDDVPVLTTVCVIGDLEEDVSAYHPERAAEKTQLQPPPPASIPVHNELRPPPFIPMSSLIRVNTPTVAAAAASPRARKLAARWGLGSLCGIHGSGPGGRVLVDDIRTAHNAGRIPTPAASRLLAGPVHDYLPGSGVGGVVRVADVEGAGDEAVAADPVAGSIVQPHSRMRQKIAAAMTQSLAQTAQLTLEASFDARALLTLRTQLKTAADAARQPNDDHLVPTINDLILFVVSRVLKRHALLNAHGADDHVRLFEAVHLGVAVDTPRGLMVPTVFDADRLPGGEIARQVRTLAALCRQGAVAPDLLQGATFTVTNLGVLGIEAFTPIINPPQTAILGVCALTARLQPNMAEGSLSTYPAIPMVLTFDHRVMDGADAARFLQDLCGTLAEIHQIYT